MITDRDIIKQKELLKIIDYNKDTGAFLWKIRASQRAKIGDHCGTINSEGYRVINIRGVYYHAHRLAWLYIYGEWPTKRLDHINGIKTDNRIDNLRMVTNRQNGMNRNIHRNGRLVGATMNGNRYKSQITINKKKIHLGTYDTELEAHNAYVDAVINIANESFLSERVVDTETTGLNKRKVSK